jgi:hypothetical protein
MKMKVVFILGGLMPFFAALLAALALAMLGRSLRRSPWRHLKRRVRHRSSSKNV